MGLSNAIEFAAYVHENQYRIGGDSFILHPLRVMFAVQEHGEEMMTAAVLHDVAEDTDFSVEILEKQLRISSEILEILDALTRRPDETHQQYIRRAAENPKAAIIKRADIMDNLREPHLITDSMIKRYNQALEILEDS